MNIEAEREHCRQAYDKWKFIRRIVELYAEGVAWQGCDRTDVDSIKNGVRGMLVTGMGQFDLKTPPPAQVSSIPMPRRYFFQEDEQSEHPFLWPVTQNTAHLDKLKNRFGRGAGAEELSQIFVKNICLGLGVPHELLGPQAAILGGDAIMGSLTTWRGYLGSCLELTWNETWDLPDLAAYGPVYQVFKAQRIELTTLAQQVLTAAKNTLDGSLISRETYGEWVKWLR